MQNYEKMVVLQIFMQIVTVPRFTGFAFSANIYLNLFYYLFSRSFVLWRLSGL